MLKKFETDEKTLKTLIASLPEDEKKILVLFSKNSSVSNFFFKNGFDVTFVDYSILPIVLSSGIFYFGYDDVKTFLNVVESFNNSLKNKKKLESVDDGIFGNFNFLSKENAHRVNFVLNKIEKKFKKNSLKKYSILKSVILGLDDVLRNNNNFFVNERVEEQSLFELKPFEICLKCLDKERNGHFILTENYHLNFDFKEFDVLVFSPEIVFYNKLGGVGMESPIRLQFFYEYVLNFNEISYFYSKHNIPLNFSFNYFNSFFYSFFHNKDEKTLIKTFEDFFDYFDLKYILMHWHLKNVLTFKQFFKTFNHKYKIEKLFVKNENGDFELVDCRKFLNKENLEFIILLKNKKQK